MDECGFISIEAFTLNVSAQWFSNTIIYICEYNYDFKQDKRTVFMEMYGLLTITMAHIETELGNYMTFGTSRSFGCLYP
jgi:hypothetical protein